MDKLNWDSLIFPYATLKITASSCTFPIRQLNPWTDFWNAMPVTLGLQALADNVIWVIFSRLYKTPCRAAEEMIQLCFWGLRSVQQKIELNSSVTTGETPAWDCVISSKAPYLQLNGCCVGIVLSTDHLSSRSRDNSNCCISSHNKMRFISVALNVLLPVELVM